MRPGCCTGVMPLRSKEMLGASWVMLRCRQLYVPRQGDPTPCCTPNPSTASEECPGHPAQPAVTSNWGLAAVQGAGRVSGHAAWQGLALQVGSCRAAGGVPAGVTASASRGDTGARYGEVPRRAQYRSVWRSQLLALCGEVSAGSGGLCSCPDNGGCIRPELNPAQGSRKPTAGAQSRTGCQGWA